MIANVPFGRNSRFIDQESLNERVGFWTRRDQQKVPSYLPEMALVHFSPLATLPLLIRIVDVYTKSC